MSAAESSSAVPQDGGHQDAAKAETHLEQAAGMTDKAAQELQNEAQSTNTSATEGKGGRPERNEAGEPSQKPRSVHDMIRQYGGPSPPKRYFHCDGHALLVDNLGAGIIVGLHDNTGAQIIEQATRPAILIVEDISEAWCNILCERFPQGLRREFIARYLLRSSDMGETCSQNEYHSYVRLVRAIETEFERTFHETKDQTVSESLGPIGEHIEAYQYADPFSGHRRGAEQWRDVPIGYRVAYSGRYHQGYIMPMRISCCELAPDLHIILVDRPWESVGDLAYALETETPQGVLLPAKPRPYNMQDVTRLLGQEQTMRVDLLASFRVLLPRRCSIQSLLRQRLGDLNRRSVIWLFLASSQWYFMVASLNERWRLLRYSVTKLPDDKAFDQLVAFRRQLADVYHNFTTTWRTIIQIDNELRDRPKHLASEEIFTDHLQDSRKIDLQALPQFFEKLDGRIRDIITALNDEIRITIGSVQIKDAKKTIKQTELATQLTESTVQQAKWTMVLALLAAFYLPMTLVTGIFGMNIKEISEDNLDKGPSSKWVVITWAVTFFFTSGYVGAYYIWQEYKEGKKKEGIEVTAPELVRSWWRAMRGKTEVASDNSA